MERDGGESSCDEDGDGTGDEGEEDDDGDAGELAQIR